MGVRHCQYWKNVSASFLKFAHFQGGERVTENGHALFGNCRSLQTVPYWWRCLQVSLGRDWSVVTDQPWPKETRKPWHQYAKAQQQAPKLPWGKDKTKTKNLHQQHVHVVRNCTHCALEWLCLFVQFLFVCLSVHLSLLLPSFAVTFAVTFDATVNFCVSFVHLYMFVCLYFR